MRNSSDEGEQAWVTLRFGKGSGNEVAFPLGFQNARLKSCRTRYPICPARSRFRHSKEAIRLIQQLFYSQR